MKILEYPEVRQLNAKEWELLEELEYHVGSKDSQDIIRVPKGFVTDFASIPKPLWPILPPFGRYSPAAVIHDYLYSTKERKRKEDDKIFLEAMKVMKVKWWVRQAMYRSVRLFGWIYRGR